MKQKKLFYTVTSIILFQFVVICVLALLVWHRSEDSSENRPPSLVKETRQKSSSPIPEELFPKDTVMDTSDIEAPIAVARVKYGKQLAAFLPFENKGKNEILKILAELYPLADENEMDEKHRIAYDTAIVDFSSPEEKEHLLLILLQMADELQQMEEAYEGKDFLADLPDTIIETEALLREMEAAGDTEEAENLRRVVTRLQEMQERNANFSESEAEAERRRQEREYYDEKYSAFKPSADILALIKERDMPGSYSEYLQLLKDEGLVPRDTPNALTDDLVSPAVLSEPSNPSKTEEVVISTPEPYDPVRSLSSAQTAFRPFRMDLEEKYFDVVISQGFTPQEIDKYFPTPQEREHLKSRTTELQKLVRFSSSQTCV